MGKLYDKYLISLNLDRELNSDFFELVTKEYDTDEVQGLKTYPQHSDIDRLQHITSVAYMTFEISRKLGISVTEATRAAVLHDLFYYDWHENDWSHRPHGYRHPGFALKNARELCGSLTKKEENAIKRHMWPLTITPPRYIESYVVVFSDKYCAARELLVSYFSYFDKRFRKDNAIMKTSLRLKKKTLASENKNKP